MASVDRKTAQRMPWQHPIRRPDEAHGFCCRVITGLCQALLVLVACCADLDPLLSKAWGELYRCRALHKPMAEAAVAAFSFFLWIAWFWSINELPCAKRFRFVARGDAKCRPITLEARFQQDLQGHNCLDTTAVLRIFSSLPVYILGILALHVTKQAAPMSPEAPTAIRLACEVVSGIIIYDFAFYWVHLAMHKFPGRWHGHEIHHKPKVHPICQTPFLGAELVVHHSLMDGFLQVLTNILVQNLRLYSGLPKHKLSRFLHNIFVTYMLAEAHSGLDLPWSLHRLMPGFYGGAHRHEFHHHCRDCCFHQFFTYLDGLLGKGPPPEDAGAPKI
mmetsp:Transcript_53119/g.95303  ORF Transcript_53119/g.95303 Transcript_53119/m.95303 type:complete len:332 (-) Transcript_53119:356-1351(-)